MNRSESKPGSSVVRPITWWRPALVGGAFWLILIALIDPFRHGGNVWSRYMTIESIVERGTQSVGKSPLLKISGSPDLVRFHGRFYSDKPPVLPAIGAIIYAPLSHVGGVRMSGSVESIALVNRVLVSTIVGLASALAVAAFRAMLQLVDVSRWGADLLAVCSGVGTLLFTYGVTFNNHSVAAGLLMAAVALGLLVSDETANQGDPTPPARRLRWRAASIGLLSSLAATIDLPAGALWCATLGGCLLVWNRRQIVPFVIGAAVPVLFHTALQWPITGSPLPVEFYPQGFEYPGSYWSTAEGTFREQGSRIWFLIELLVGPQGWLTVTPLLWLAPLGLVVGWREGGRMRAFAAMTIITSAVLVAYYAFGVRRTDFSGLSYGTRHLLAITPIVAFWSVYGVFAGRWRRMVAPVLVGLWGVGFIYAYEGMRDPWSRIERRPEASLRVLQNVVLYPYTSYQR